MASSLMLRVLYRNLLKMAVEADRNPSMKAFLAAPLDHWDSVKGKYTTPADESLTADEAFADKHIAEFCGAQRYAPRRSLAEYVRDQFGDSDHSAAPPSESAVLACLRRVRQAHALWQENVVSPTHLPLLTPLEPCEVVKMDKVRVGSLLVAHPTQVFRPTRQAVVLMTRRYEGVALNLPICGDSGRIHTLGEILSPGSDSRLELLRNVPCYYGGPDKDKNFLLHPYWKVYERRKQLDPTLPTSVKPPILQQEGWFVCELTADVLDMLREVMDPERAAEDGVKVFVGRMYWQVGQLRAEIERNLWFPLREAPPLPLLYTCDPVACPAAASEPLPPAKPPAPAEAEEKEEKGSAGSGGLSWAGTGGGVPKLKITEVPPPDVKVSLASEEGNELNRVDPDELLTHAMWSNLLRNMGAEFASFGALRPWNQVRALRILEKLRLYPVSSGHNPADDL
eukprot:RCo050213